VQAALDEKVLHQRQTGDEFATDAQNARLIAPDSPELPAVAEGGDIPMICDGSEFVPGVASFEPEVAPMTFPEILRRY
jgi:hypothetical protein